MREHPIPFQRHRRGPASQPHYYLRANTFDGKHAGYIVLDVGPNHDTKWFIGSPLEADAIPAELAGMLLDAIQQVTPGFRLTLVLAHSGGILTRQMMQTLNLIPKEKNP